MVGVVVGTADWARCMAKKADGAGGGGRYEALKDMVQSERYSEWEREK